MRKTTSLLLILLFAYPLTTLADGVILRTELRPEKPWVGQKVLLHIDVLAKDGWAQLKKVQDAEIKGAYMLRLETQGTHLKHARARVFSLPGGAGEAQVWAAGLEHPVRLR